MDTCPCGSGRTYEECCLPLIKGTQQAETAEQLMRSRYSAYAKSEINYLKATLHPDHRSDFDEKTTSAWAEGAEWHGLEILETSGGGAGDTAGRVEFTASFTQKGLRQVHRELATFKKEDSTWYFVNGETVPVRQFVRSAPKTGRNDPCQCGSGRKFKKCCGKA